MKTHTTPAPLGSFNSTPIHAHTWAAAHEVLSRTYGPERWELRRISRHDHKRLHFGARYSFTFLVCPQALEPVAVRLRRHLAGDGTANDNTTDELYRIANNVPEDVETDLNAVERWAFETINA